MEEGITMMRLKTLKTKLEALGYVAYLHDDADPLRLTLSAEESHNGRYPADYWAGGDDYGSFIEPDVRALAKQADGYWEWVNPGELVFVRS
jgi:hypothetical protein